MTQGQEVITRRIEAVERAVIELSDRTRDGHRSLLSELNLIRERITQLEKRIVLLEATSW